MPPPITGIPNRPKGRSLRPLRELVPFIRPHWRMLVLALEATLVGAGALLGLPVALRYVVDFGIAGKSGRKRRTPRSRQRPGPPQRRLHPRPAA